MPKRSKDFLIAFIEENELLLSYYSKDCQLWLGQLENWNFEDGVLVEVLALKIEEVLDKAGKIVKPREIVFVLPPSWTDGKGEILPTYKKDLQFLCQKKKLSPLGFLVGEEVLTKFFKGFTSVYLGNKYFRVSTYWNEKLVEREEAQSDKLVDPEGIFLLLKRLQPGKPLPSSLVFWGKNAETLKEKLLSFEWSKSGVFEKTVNTEILGWETFFNHLIKLVTGKGKVTTEVDKAKLEVKGGPSFKVENWDFEKVDKSDGAKEIPFGFVKGDVSELNSGTNGKGLSQVGTKKEVVEKRFEKKGLGLKEKLPEINSERNVSQFNFSCLKYSFSKLGERVAVFSGRIKKKGGVRILALVFLGLAFSLFLSWFFFRAKVYLYVTPEELSKETQIVLDPEATSIDLSGKIVPAQEISKEVSGEEQVFVSGDKLVGEKATGKVIVYNRTNETVTFEAGTRLLGLAGLEFVLEESLTVASKSADLASGLDRWGEAAGLASASEIGSEYNLAKDAVFTISDYSLEEFLAKNLDDFSGGTARKIKVVSEEDRDSLKKSLERSLVKKAKEEITSEVLIDPLNKDYVVEVLSEKYSNEVGEEAGRLTLDLKVKVSSMVVDKSLLVKFAKLFLEDSLKEGLAVEESDIKTSLSVGEFDSEGAKVDSGQLSIIAQTYPIISREALADELVGKSHCAIKEIIRNYPRIYRYEVETAPRFWKLISRLPIRPNRIEVIVEK